MALGIVALLLPLLGVSPAHGDTDALPAQADTSAKIAAWRAASARRSDCGPSEPGEAGGERSLQAEALRKAVSHWCSDAYQSQHDAVAAHSRCDGATAGDTAAELVFQTRRLLAPCSVDSRREPRRRSHHRCKGFVGKQRAQTPLQQCILFDVGFALRGPAVHLQYFLGPEAHIQEKLQVHRDLSRVLNSPALVNFSSPSIQVEVVASGATTGEHAGATQDGGHVPLLEETSRSEKRVADAVAVLVGGSGLGVPGWTLLAHVLGAFSSLMDFDLLGGPREDPLILLPPGTEPHALEDIGVKGQKGGGQGGRGSRGQQKKTADTAASGKFAGGLGLREVFGLLTSRPPVAVDRFVLGAEVGVGRCGRQRGRERRERRAPCTCVILTVEVSGRFTLHVLRGQRGGGEQRRRRISRVILGLPYSSLDSPFFFRYLIPPLTEA